MGWCAVGRTLPYECHHGTIIDWGDFGPHQNGCDDECFESDGRCPDQPGCDLCDQEEQWAEGVRWTLIGDAIRGFLMEKHVPFDVMDEWADEIVAIVREHLGHPPFSGSSEVDRG